MKDPGETAEARLFLQWAAQVLNKTERIALEGIASAAPQVELAREIGITPAGVCLAQRKGLRKMREALSVVGITSSQDFFSGGAW